MDKVLGKQLKNWLANDKDVKISILLPMSDSDEKNQIQYRNLIRKTKNHLETNYPRKEWEDTLKKFDGLSHESDFWKKYQGSVLILGLAGKLEIFYLNYPTEEKWFVGNYFLLAETCLIEATLKNTYLVDLGKDRLELYSLNGGGGTKVFDDGELKKNFSDYYEDFDNDSTLNVGSYGGLTGTHHGHRAKSEQVKKEQQIYYDYLNDYFVNWFKKDGARFIFSGTGDTLAVYQQISQGQAYLLASLSKPYSAFTSSEFKVAVGKVLTQEKAQAVDKLKMLTRKATEEQKVLTDEEKVIEAVVSGRIKEVILYLPSLTIEDKIEKMVNQLLLYGVMPTVIVDESFKEVTTIQAVLY